MREGLRIANAHHAARYARILHFGRNSACSSNSLDPSHVLSALSIPRNLAQGSLRISLGEDASIQQADLFIEAFKEVVDAWS